MLEACNFRSGAFPSFYSMLINKRYNNSSNVALLSTELYFERTEPYEHGTNNECSALLMVETNIVKLPGN